MIDVAVDHRNVIEMDAKQQSPLSRYHGILTALGLLVFNVALVFPLFRGGYTPYMGSIETTWLTNARFAVEHFPHVSWDPLWYMGVPFRLIYPPALVYIVAGLHSVPGISIASAYRIVTGAFYVFTPVTLFFFVYYLTGRRGPAAIGAFVYSLAPSFCYLISDVRSDAASFGYAPWQLAVMLRYGEGPHISSLAFTPLAALGLMRAMRRPSLRNTLFAALAISAVALINVIGLFALAVVLFVVVVSEILVGRGWEKLKSALACMLLTYGLCAFWYNFSFLQTWFGFGGRGAPAGTFPALENWPILFMVGLVAMVPAVIFFSGNAGRQPAFVIGAWLVVFSIITFAWYGMGIALAPQGNRYMPEMNMAAAVAVGILAESSGRRLWHRKVKWARLMGAAIPLAILVLVVVGSMPYLQLAHVVTSPNPDITATSEYQVAQWLSAHVGDERAYATGSHSFWLNVFTDVPQIRGGADQGATNVWWNQVSYQINTGEDGAIAILWARALGVKYIVVSSPGSADVYQDYLYPAKFDGLLPKVYDNRGMSIYEVTLRQRGLVQVIDLPAYNSLLPIRDAVDADHLSHYAELVEGSLPVKDYRFVSNDRLEFDTDLQSSQQAVMVRMTYDPGWQAYCNGQRVPIRQDLAGFILIEPQLQGHYHFVLQRSPLWDELLGYALTTVTIAALIVTGVVRFRSFRSRKPGVQSAQQPVGLL